MQRANRYKSLRARAEQAESSQFYDEIVRAYSKKRLGYEKGCIGPNFSQAGAASGNAKQEMRSWKARLAAKSPVAVHWDQ